MCGEDRKRGVRSSIVLHNCDDYDIIDISVGHFFLFLTYDFVAFFTVQCILSGSSYVTDTVLKGNSQM